MVALPHPPPTSAVFPYTTLFRSRQLHAARLNVQDVITRIPLGEDGFSAPILHDLPRKPLGVEERLRVERGRGSRCGAGGLDRKSTRLNSSHRCIAYAAFCLKKRI